MVQLASYIVGYSFTVDSKSLLFDYADDIRLYELATSSSSRLINSGASPEAPSIRTQDGRIAGYSFGNGLYLYNPDGTNETKIPNTQLRDFFPTWSPDGQWIAFLRRTTVSSIDYQELCKIKPDGTSLTKLSNYTGLNAITLPFSPPKWSTDGTKAYVTGTVGNAAGIYSLSTSSLQPATLVLSTAAQPDFVSGLFDPAATIAATTTKLSSSATNPAYGTPITLTATVTPVSGSIANLGSVTFTIDGSFTQTVKLVGNQASITPANLVAGSHTVRAYYNPPAGYSFSSANATQQIASSALTTGARIAYS